MLDHCSISHKGGLVLWSRSFTPDAARLASSSSSPVNSLIREALIEGRTTEEQYEKDGYAVKWTFVNDLELIFVVAYQRILQLTYVNDLLAALRSLFVKYFEPFLISFVASLHAIETGKIANAEATSWNFAKVFEGWDDIFDKLLKGLEDRAMQDRKARLRTVARPLPEQFTPPSDDQSTAPSRSSDTPHDEQQIARNVQALKNRLRGRGGRRGGGSSRVASRTGADSVPASDSESPAKRKVKTKVQRKWGDEPVTESDMASLDFSLDKDGASNANVGSHDLQALVDQASLGTRTRDGLYEVKDWEFSKDVETDKFIANALQPTAATPSSLGTLGTLFARLTGSKVLSEQDLKPVLEGMKQHLMKKNVAKEISEKVCEGVGESLVGKKVGGFQTTNAAVRMALSTSLTRILTPKTSTDLLLSIRTKLSSPLPSSQQRMPYSITFVGVNGVGKSTNLSKVCFWLIQNGLRVLIAACDTFRSGAVEQLRVHVRNLSMLGVNGATDSKGRVELFERGYGKDAAAIAKEAISFARDNDFDVVLIDTAGRMQDNEPLMRALAKLVSVNNPDKIIFVGEALVGNEAVDQLTKFDRALRDFSSASGSGKGRGIDGMLVTKWDTVDDKVGAALSMTILYVTPLFRHSLQLTRSCEATTYPNALIYGGSDKIPGLTNLVKDKDEFTLGDNTHIKCLATPCHTQDSICYHVTDTINKTHPGGVFTGDTLFIAGCGRFFEGTGDEMNRALRYLATLPDSTLVYNGHEYTSGSLSFAKSIDPNNEAIARLANIVEKNKITTGLTTIGDEKKWNVFMRLSSDAVRSATAASPDTPESVIIDSLRNKKNNHRA
ncbi:hypothetical protein H0H81_001422 [Sphagnurus paluster]|uniref:Signal recognition particle receptor subunit alpha homolog n=1 Tax=Sphagnurus paluster TaxID=117069 RepID=A0A9P7GUN3_9AGAR|nr:hypothetical protein H0H81_001422 [Sphagnurus paluster]